MALNCQQISRSAMPISCSPLNRLICIFILTLSLYTCFISSGYAKQEVKQQIAISAVVSGRVNAGDVVVQESSVTKRLSGEGPVKMEVSILRGLVILFFVATVVKMCFAYVRNKKKSDNENKTEDDIYYLTTRKNNNEGYEKYINEIQYLDRKKLLEAKRDNENGDDHCQKWFIWRRIKFMLRNSMKFILPINNKDPHEEVAIRVYERLRLRNAQLRELEEQAQEYLINKEKQDDEITIGKRAYHLASTDLFVEKAMTYLEDRAEKYKNSGHRKILFGQSTYFFGTVLALLMLANFQIIGNEESHFLGFIHGFTLELPTDQNLTERIITTEPNGKITKVEKYYANHTMDRLSSLAKNANHSTDRLSSFAKSFSALGMIVLLGVSFTRYGKVMLDQSERLLERRHALRQGRLFVHLNDGKLDINEMEKAFNWNVAGANSFSHLPTESHAPWGSVIKEIGHKVPELMQSVIEAISGKRK